MDNASMVKYLAVGAACAFFTFNRPVSVFTFNVYQQPGSDSDAMLAVNQEEGGNQEDGPDPATKWQQALASAEARASSLGSLRACKSKLPALRGVQEQAPSAARRSGR